MEPPMPCKQDVETTRKRRRKSRRRCKRHPQEGPHSPTCRGQTNVAYYGYLVRALPQLKPVLDYLNVKGDTFTRAQIMGHLTEYIKKKSLYDPVDPRKVYCENDPLGDIFGCKEFSTANACELLLQNLENVSSATTDMEPHSSKRVTGCDTSSCCPRTKITCVSTTDTCSCSESDQQSTSDLPCSSLSIATTSGIKRNYESAFSVNLNCQQPATSSASTSSYSHIQVKDSSGLTFEYLKHYKVVCEDATDVVTDTSDDLFFLNETDEERVVRQVDTDEETVFSLEYEPISFSEEERLVAMHGLQDEPLGSEATDDTEVDEGEDGGDELGNSDSSDSEIEEEDKWQCESCPERNHPMSRRCRGCWTVRRDWYPATLNRTSSDPGRIQTELNQTQEPAATVSDSASTSRAPVANVVSHAKNESPSEASIVDGYGRMKCMICRKEPPNGCIVHGRTGHQVCCVVCAQKLKDDNKPCPVCRKRIGKVIKNFM